ncbi:hypothetical protein [Methylobacterium symbioticum]|uniref:N-acetyltransferase domain-containing protein n=2 Tax=Methylobacterium symbioticum TaxID=2584084 RepID=A0A509EDY2_9HYPH|nr:hypothetical protein MET9862_02372 [Methylobacterium symbioticum]
MRLQAIDHTDLAAAWRIAEPWLARACARPGCDLSAPELLDLCATGRALLVGIFDGPDLVAAGVSQVRQHGDGSRTCWVLAVGGAGARAWRHTLRQIEAGAAARGARRVEFVGRPGWRRLLPDYAAAPCEAGIHFTKDLLR